MQPFGEQKDPKCGAVSAQSVVQDCGGESISDESEGWTMGERLHRMLVHGVFCEA